MSGFGYRIGKKKSDEETEGVNYCETRETLEIMFWPSFLHHEGVVLWFQMTFGTWKNNVPFLGLHAEGTEYKLLLVFPLFSALH